MTTTRVLNFLGGPGAGKSTVKAGTFFHLKIAGYRVAQVEEYATERSFEEDWATLADQAALLKEQDSRQRRLLGRVDWIVTDSPLVLSRLYGSGVFAGEDFQDAVETTFASYENINVWLDRPRSPYQTYGRHHSEAEAKDLDQKLFDLMKNRIDFRTEADENTPQRVVQYLADRFK